jgi:type I restriction enzyme S subunit
MYFDNDYAVPVGWQKLSIGQICKKFTSGGTPSRKNLDFYINGTIPWVKTKELNDGYIADVEELITEEALSNSSAKKLPKDTVLMAMYGATVGKLGILPFEAACNQACAAMVVDEEFSDFKFLFYLLKNWRSEIIAQATGAAQQNLSGELVRNFEFDFPPVEIQNAIGELLGTLDEKIRANKQIASTLEQIAQTVFKSWFVDFDPVHTKARGEQPLGMDAETAALFPDSFEDSELGPIPAGWKVSPISECSKVVVGGTPSRKVDEYWDGMVPWINSGKTNEFRVTQPSEYITELGVQKSAAKLMPVGTTIMAMTGATLGQFSRMEIQACGTQNVIGILDDGTWPNEFIYFTIALAMDKVLSGATGGAQQHVSKSIVEEIAVVNPGHALSVRFAEVVLPFFSQIANLEFQNHSLVEIRDSLLPRLISGELEIPSELLEA